MHIRNFIAGLVAIGFLTASAGAFAQEAADVTTVVVPYGSWLDSVLANAQGIAVAAILGLVTIASRKAPAWAATIIKTALTEQMLAHAVAFGINAVRGAVQGKSLSVDVGSRVLAEAFGYVIDKAPAWFLKYVGGAENLKTMILARLQLDADADAATLLKSVPVVHTANGPRAVSAPPVAGRAAPEAG